MEIDFDLKVKLFKEYLENGGYEKIVFPELLEDLLKTRSLPNGNPDPSTFSSSVRAAMNAIVASQLMPPFLSDTRLSEYETLLQKEIFYDQTNVETEKEFEEVFEKYNNRKDILFRGLSEAKYRLYSSLQRQWITMKLYEKHKSYQEFLERLLSNARQEQAGALSKYLKSTGFDPENDLAVLSFLQHHGCPTPLLDWTYNFCNALYFATENVKTSEGKHEIDDYICVYFLEEEFLEKNSMKEIVESGLKENNAKFKQGVQDNMKSKGFTDEQIAQTFPDEYVTDIFLMLHGKGAMTFMTKVDKLITLPILYFSDENKNFKLKYYLNNNMNIVNQQGVFTWNSNPTKPIEHVANEEYNSMHKESTYRFSQCININKRLANYVKEKLTSFGVTKDFIYPDPWKISQATFDKTK